MLASHTSSASVIEAFDALPQPVFVIEALRRGQANAYVNAAYEALTGHPAAEAVAAGFDALAIFVAGDEVAALAEDAEPPSKTVSIKRRDGTTVDAVLHLRAVRHSGGGTHIIGMLSPVGSPPQSATADAAGRRAFLSWLNHELRSPLNACGMWLDVLALMPQPDKLGKAVDAIKRNLARQTRLLNDLSDAARAFDDRLEMKPAPLELGPLLMQGLAAAQASALAKTVTLEHAVDVRRDARLVGDGERLLQALNHVLENAIGSTPAGGRVAVRAHEAHGSCHVEIEDAGLALSDDDIAHLGTPLWRSPQAKSRTGLGLGLAVAHHIVTHHNGSLTASSGKAGTRFVLTLPLAATAD